MYYCPTGHLLTSQTAHCTHYGCGWQNPLFVAEEVALATGNLELAEDLAIMNGDYNTAMEIAVLEAIDGGLGF